MKLGNDEGGKLREQPPILSNEQTEKIYYKEYDKAKAFSERYATSLSPSNFFPNRPADRQRSFDVTHREEVYRAIATAQRDADAAYYEPLIEQAKAEVAGEILPCLREVLFAPTHEANDYNCQDWPIGEGCSGCKGDKVRDEVRKQLAAFESKYTGGKLSDTLSNVRTGVKLSLGKLPGRK